MSARQHRSELLGAYVLGVLDEREVWSVEDHLAGCAPCREELRDLRAMEADLGEVPPEAFLDGPPAGDLLLGRILRRAHDERDVERGRRRSVLAAVAVAASAVVLGGGYLAGLAAAPAGGADAGPRPPSTGATASPPPAGTVVASAKDPGTGARMAVRMTPASDWVRLNVAVSGIPAGERCRLVVVTKDGEREVAGSWLVGNKEKGANLDGSAAVAREDVAAIVVENEAGEEYVTAYLRT